MRKFATWLLDVFAQRKALLGAIGSIATGVALLTHGQYDSGVAAIVSGILVLAHLHG